MEHGVHEQFHDERACVQLPAYADNVALPAFVRPPAAAAAIAGYFQLARPRLRTKLDHTRIIKYHTLKYVRIVKK